MEDLLLIWERTLGSLQDSVDPRLYASWIRSLKIQECDGNPTIICPNNMALVYVEKMFKDAISEAFSSNGGLGTLSFKCEQQTQIGRSFIQSPAVSKTVLPAQSGAAVQKPQPPEVFVSSLNTHQSSKRSSVRSKSDRSGSQTPGCIYEWSLEHGSLVPVQNSLMQKKTFDNFYQGNTNSVAYVAAEKMCNEIDKEVDISNPLYIYGKPGLGKTHLLWSIGNRICKTHPAKKVIYVDAQRFLEHISNIFSDVSAKTESSKRVSKLKDGYSQADVLLIDDIQHIAKGQATQDAMFIIFNNLFNNQKRIIMTSDKVPGELQKMSERLVSRLSQGAQVLIDPPSLEDRLAITGMKAKEMSISIDQDAIKFIGSTFRTSVREIEGALKTLSLWKQSEKMEGSLTTAHVKQALESQISTLKRTISPVEIIRLACECFAVTKSEMLGPKKDRRVSSARQIAMYVTRELTDLSLPDIGSEFGDKDHTTVLNAWKKISEKLNKGDPDTIAKHKQLMMCIDYKTENI